MENDLVAQAIDRIDKFLKLSGMSESMLGLKSCGNARAVERIRSQSATIATLRDVLAYIDAHPVRASGK